MKLKFEKFAVIPALATLFKVDESFDEQSERKLIDMLLKKNVDGFYVGGSTGEGFSLSMSERKKLISTAIEETNKRVPIIAYIGCIDTKRAIELARFAEDSGADALSSVPPYYYGFTWEEIKSYYRDIAQSISIPLIIYNNPGCTGIGFSVDMAEEMFEIDNIAGIKYTAPNHFEMQLIKNLCGGKKLVFSGADEMFISAVGMGVDGAIGSTYNLIPEIYMDIAKSYKNGETEKATRLMRAANIVVKELVYSDKYMGYMKAWLSEMGIGGYMCKRPFATVTPSDFTSFINKLKSYGINEELKNTDLMKF